MQTFVRGRGEALRYELGQTLCESHFVPGQVLLIESGSARLLGEQGSRLSTLTKLEEGQIVGAASLLRGAPCEDVRAATDLVARRISDEDFLNLVHNNSEVAASCQNHLWTAELAALLKSLLENAPKQTRPLSSWIEELLPQAHLLNPTDSDAVQLALTSNQRLFIAGESNEPGNTQLGEEISNLDEIASLPTGIHELPLRLIALPEEAIQELNKSVPVELVTADLK